MHLLLLKRHLLQVTKTSSTANYTFFPICGDSQGTALLQQNIHLTRPCTVVWHHFVAHIISWSHHQKHWEIVYWGCHQQKPVKQIYKLTCLEVSWFFIFLSLHQMVPLHVAAEAGRHKIVGFIFGAKVDINMKDDQGVGIWDYTTLWHFQFELALTQERVLHHSFIDVKELLKLESFW